MNQVDSAHPLSCGQGRDAVVHQQLRQVRAHPASRASVQASTLGLPQGHLLRHVIGSGKADTLP